MNNYRASLIVPETHSDGSPTPAHVFAHVEGAFCRTFGGFTVYRAEGGWAERPGAILREPVRVVWAEGPGDRRVLESRFRALADDVRHALAQSVVLYRIEAREPWGAVCSPEA